MQGATWPVPPTPSRARSSRSGSEAWLGLEPDVGASLRPARAPAVRKRLDEVDAPTQLGRLGRLGGNPQSQAVERDRDAGGPVKRLRLDIECRIGGPRLGGEGVGD